MKNVIYYPNIEQIGGVSTYEYELAIKYCKSKDITLYYREGDAKQISKLRKYIRVIKWRGEDVECDSFFTNYNFEEFIPHVKLSGKGHTYQVIHAMYITNRVKPKVYDFFDYYICVSDIVKKEFQELTNLPDSKFIVSHNPLTIQEQDLKPCLIIGIFQRLKYAWEKGEKRIDALIKRLDVANINYLMLIASNDKPFKSKNITYIEPRVDNVRNVMAICDCVWILSDCEGDNYTSKEAKGVGCKILSTPLDCMRENNIIGNQDKILEFDLSNIDEVVDWLIEMYKNKESRHSDYKQIEDKYDEILLDGKSNYMEEQYIMKVKVLVNGITDGNKVVPIGYVKEVEDSEDIRKLINMGWLEELKEAPKEEVKVAIQEPKEVKKAVRKTTKNAKK